MRLVVLIGFIVCCGQFTHAQDIWTLEKCIDTAVAKSNAIQQLGLDQKMAEIDRQSQKFGFLPYVNGTANQGYFLGRSIDPVSNTFTQDRRQNSSFSINGGLVLFNGMSRYHTLKQSALTLDDMVLQQKILLRSIKMQVLTFYLQALVDQESVNLANENLAYTAHQLKQLQEKVNAGLNAEADLIEIKAQKAQDELTLFQAQNNFEYTRIQLTQLLLIKNQDQFKIDTNSNYLMTQEVSFPDVDKLPELERGRLQIEQLILDKKVAGSGYYPSLSLNAGIGSGYSDSYFLFDTETGEFFVPDFPTQFNENVYQSLSLSLNIPIYSQNQNRARVSTSEIQTQKARLQLEQTKIDMANTLYELNRDLKNASAELNMAKEQLKLSEEDFKNTELKYQKGVITFTELLAKKDRLYASKFNWVQKKYNYYFLKRMALLYLD